MKGKKEKRKKELVENVSGWEKREGKINKRNGKNKMLRKLIKSYIRFSMLQI